MIIHFWVREKTTEHPAGTTVSKRAKLPSGDFGLTEYRWGEVSLYFLDSDKFTADERQEAFLRFPHELLPQAKEDI